MARASASAADQIRKSAKQAVKAWALGLSFVFLITPTKTLSQDGVFELELSRGSTVEVVNPYGRISVRAEDLAAGEGAPTSKLTVTSPDAVPPGAVKLSRRGSKLSIIVAAPETRNRVDVSLVVPARVKLKLETTAGAIEVGGDISVIEAKTDTGTIITNVPLVDLQYKFSWTESRPRVVADFELEKVKERRGGRFELAGKHKEMANTGESDESEGSDGRPDNPEGRKRNLESVSLDFSTARGIILVNVPPNEVTSDLRERPLTNAAKAIIRSGDSLLMEAIRRASPRYFGDYARSLPPYSREPAFSKRSETPTLPEAAVKTADIRVTDTTNRSLDGLSVEDFEVIENSVQREVLSVRRSDAAFNMVLLLDVSGSVENYVNFIRKAARNFVSTVDGRDKLAIVTFNEDVKVLSGFTTDKGKLSVSLDTFDAGGGTAYYDALAFTIAEMLRPLKGGRTAIVILTDGDDNRSFLAFDSLIGSIQESGALIYPLYVPSGLISMSETTNDVDPLRKKYMSLSAKSEGEGERLAKISGGVYYPITEVAQIQTAYEDISRQLRSAYEITFRSVPGTVSSRVRVKAKRPNAIVSLTQVRAGN